MEYFPESKDGVRMQTKFIIHPLLVFVGASQEQRCLPQRPVNQRAFVGDGEVGDGRGGDPFCLLRGFVNNA